MDTVRNAVVRFLESKNAGKFLHPGAFELKLEVPFWISFGVETTLQTDDTKISTSSMRYAPSPSRIQRDRRKTKKQRDG